MSNPQIVIDTNVLVSALRSKNGHSFVLFNSIATGLFDHCVSASLLLEYEDVLKRYRLSLNLTDSEIDQLIDYLCETGRKTLIYFHLEATHPDAGDTKVLELAVAASADCIVTFNKRHFADAHRFGVRALTPFEFLSEVRAPS